MQGGRSSVGRFWYLDTTANVLCQKLYLAEALSYEIAPNIMSLCVYACLQQHMCLASKKCVWGSTMC